MSPSLHSDSAALSYPCAKLHQKVPPILVLFNQISFWQKGFLLCIWQQPADFKTLERGAQRKVFLPISSSQKIGGGLSNVSIKILCGGGGVRHNSTELRKFVSRAPFLLPSLPPPPPFLSLVKNFGNSNFFIPSDAAKKAKFQFERRP